MASPKALWDLYFVKHCILYDSSNSQCSLGSKSNYLVPVYTCSVAFPLDLGVSGMYCLFHHTNIVYVLLSACRKTYLILPW